MKHVFHGAAVFSAWLMLAPVALAETLPGIKERGSLRIGVSMFAPWTIEDEDGELAGFEIEVGRRVAQAMGVDPEFKVYIWDEIIDGLEQDDIDIIAAGMSITPFRALRVDFSDPCSEAGFTIVANKNAVTRVVENVKSLDVDEYVVAIVDATLSGQAAPLFFDSAEIRAFPEPESAEAAVLSGRAQIYLTSAPEATILVSEYPDQLVMPLAEPLAGAPGGFAVRRGNETLLGFLNDWIRETEVQQWLDTTYEYWLARAR
jgi:polar amino acid transport system substrate-binding protein